MEITVWNYKEVEDEFLGEVLLDLSEARIDNTPTCYHLEDHDENSSPLPYRLIFTSFFFFFHFNNFDNFELSAFKNTECINIVFS